MKNAILILQIIISVALSVAILLQNKGTGLGSSFGDTGAAYRSKRGVEKLLYRGTIVLAALFLLTSLVNLLVR